jgi:hypothetical protein
VGTPQPASQPAALTEACPALPAPRGARVQCTATTPGGPWSLRPLRHTTLVAADWGAAALQRDSARSVPTRPDSTQLDSARHDTAAGGRRAATRARRRPCFGLWVGLRCGFPACALSGAGARSPRGASAGRPPAPACRLRKPPRIPLRLRSGAARVVPALRAGAGFLSTTELGRVKNEACDGRSSKPNLPGAHNRGRGRRAVKVHTRGPRRASSAASQPWARGAPPWSANAGCRWHTAPA